MASKTRISKRTGKPVRAYRKAGTKPARAKVKAKVKVKVRAKKVKAGSKSSKPPSLGPQGEEALWKPAIMSPELMRSLNEKRTTTEIASQLLYSLARGAGAYPTGEDIRDLVRNVRVMLSEVDHPTIRPVDKPQPSSEVAALPFQEDDLLEGLG